MVFFFSNVLQQCEDCLISIISKHVAAMFVQKTVVSDGPYHLFHLIGVAERDFRHRFKAQKVLLSLDGKLQLPSAKR